MNGDVVHIRVPADAARGQGRTPRERLMVRSPSLVPAVLRGVERLPVRSRLRRSLIVQACAMGWDAVSRGDFELLLMLYHPEAVYSTEMPPELRLPDSPRGGSFRGREAIREYVANFHVSWSEVRFELRDVLIMDDGSRILCMGDLHTQGLTSGIEVEIPIATLVEVREGMNVRQQDYWDHADALRGAGLDPEAFPQLLGR